MVGLVSVWGWQWRHWWWLDVLTHRCGPQLLHPADMLSVVISRRNQIKQNKTLNPLGMLSYCGCKVLVCHWQPSFGLNLPGVWVYSTAPNMLLPFMHGLFSGSLVNFHSGVFRRQVCHLSSLSSSITTAVRVIRGKRWNQLFTYFLLLGKIPPTTHTHRLSGSEPIEKRWGGCF